MSDSKLPSYQSAEFAAFLPLWQKVDTCLGGTEAMRKAGTLYLPQFPLEHDDVYAQRLAASTFYPAYGDTVDGITGTIFRKPLQLGANVSAPVAADLENADLAGTHYEVLGQQIFTTGLHYGAAYVLVDMPRRPAEGVFDAAQARASNFRPFWVVYGAAELANWPRYVVINGAPVLQQIVFREAHREAEGFGEECRTRYRVWRLPTIQGADGAARRAGNAEWEIWEEQQAERNNTKTALVLIDSGTSPLPDIPVAIFNANAKLSCRQETDGPVLLDLANLNIKLYQQESDHEANLHLCTPIPFTVNLRQEHGQETQFAWGPGVLFHCDEGGMVGYAQPGGTGLSERREWMNGLKQQLLELGMALAVEGSQKGGMTATEAILRGGTRSSRLTQLARAFQDCMEVALGFHAQWKGLGMDAGGEITLGVKDADLVVTAQDAAAYAALQAAGQLSLQTLWAIIQRGGILPDDFDAQRELQRLADERRVLPAVRGSNGGGINPATF